MDDLSSLTMSVFLSPCSTPCWRCRHSLRVCRVTHLIFVCHANYFCDTSKFGFYRAVKVFFLSSDTNIPTYYQSIYCKVFTFSRLALPYHQRYAGNVTITLNYKPKTCRFFCFCFCLTLKSNLKSTYHEY